MNKTYVLIDLLSIFKPAGEGVVMDAFSSLNPGLKVVLFTQETLPDGVFLSYVQGLDNFEIISAEQLGVDEFNEAIAKYFAAGSENALQSGDHVYIVNPTEDLLEKCGIPAVYEQEQIEILKNVHSDAEFKVVDVTGQDLVDLVQELNAEYAPAEMFATTEVTETDVAVAA
jgi:hypothetical protein